MNLSPLVVESKYLAHLKDLSVVSVWVGDDAMLKCEDNNLESGSRFWNKDDDEMLAAGSVVMSNNYRIKQLNNSATLVITNVNQGDEGKYVCTVNAKPKYTRVYHLHVEVFKCKIQEQPLHGFYRNETLTGELSSYKAGDRIRYFCNDGYHLVGMDLRTCNSSMKQWLPEEPPYCEPKFIERLSKQIKRLESKMEVDISKVNQQIKTIQNHLQPANSDNLSAKAFPNSMTEKDLTEWFWESCQNEQNQTNIKISETVNKRVYLVAEYKWVLEDVKKRLELLSPTAREAHESPPFYVFVPGYRFKLKYTLFNQGQFYLDLQIIKGKFDDKLKWPVRIKYELISVRADQTEQMYYSFDPRENTNCLIKRPQLGASARCTKEETMINSHYTRHFVKDFNMLDDGSVVFKAHIYMNTHYDNKER
ncbi:hypothetical protein CHUAL_007628 [Chamberlinius hualienensis]